MSTLLEMQTKLGDLEAELGDLMPKIPENLGDKISELESMLGDSKLKLEALEGLPAVQEDWEKQLQEVCYILQTRILDQSSSCFLIKIQSPATVLKKSRFLNFGGFEGTFNKYKQFCS